MLRLAAATAPRLAMVQAFHSSPFTRNRHVAASSLSMYRNTLSQQQHQVLLRLGTIKWGTTTSSALTNRWHSSSSSTTTTSLQARFQVGDAVWVQDGDSTDSGSTSSPKQGIIQDIRGRGWYTIRLQEETLFGPEILKCRGNQLRRLASQQPEKQQFPQQERQQQQPQQQLQPRQQQNLGLFQETVIQMYNEERKPLVTPPPPPPTIINLDQAIREQQQQQESGDAVLSTRDQIYLQQVAHHATFTKWVVFTDLHCSPSSLNTCLQVLQHVHQLAVERNAGVLFLGDWWHHRGTLRVDCVNAVLEELSTWHVPMILIPGNHDQVTLGGHSHGLTVLENSYRVVEAGATVELPATNNSTITPTTAGTMPQSLLSNGNNLRKSHAGPLVFSYPTLFQKALFIPHIRDNAVMESVLMSTEATQEATSIFCHVDVKGALMNDMIRSEGGVPPYLFPTHIPIYSGHFHKHHSLARRQDETPIEYLGSPYQTSLSEAQQDKALAVVDSSQNWTCVERIPVTFGTQHFKVYSIQSLLRLKPGAPIEKSDRIILTVTKESLAKAQQGSYVNGVLSPLDSHIETLRAVGASVEIRTTKMLPPEAVIRSNPSGSNEIEEMTPSTTWKTFLSSQVERTATSNTTYDTLLKAGLQVLDKLDDRDEEEQSPVESSRQNAVDLQLHTVKIEGFGPFHKPITYPLHNRGLVLLRGTNKDGGSDSNGSGKSSLAMAALWALTGSIDPRPTIDSKNTDIINDNSKVAKVSVSGALNGVEFIITRMKASSKGQLSFILGGKDLTTQAAKETQHVIDEKLGVGPEILARTIFHGQHTMNGLLESTDVKLKEELSLVVPLSIWQDAATRCRLKAREASKKAAEMEGMLRVRAGEISKLQGRLHLAQAELDRKQQSLNSLEEQLRAEQQGFSEHFDTTIITGTISADLESIKRSLDCATEDVSLAAQKQHDLVKDRDNEIQPIRLKVDELTKVFESARSLQQSREREYDLARLRADTSNSVLKTLEEKWSVTLGLGTDQVDLIIPSMCPTCLQPIQAGIGEHSHEGIKQVFEVDISSALDNARVASSALTAAGAAKEEASIEFHDAETQLMRARDRLKEATDRWDTLVNEANKQLSLKRAAQETLSKAFTTAATSMQRFATAKQLEVAVAGARDAAASALAAYNTVKDDLMEAQVKQQELSATLEEEKNLSALMTDLVDGFGARGVQAFVLQTVVDALQTKSQMYLNELSDGSIQLQLSIDSGDRISRTAFVRNPSGDFVERPLASLSGGQWRRCSIALSLGFADLVASRGRMRPSLCVLDEPLTFLDTSGRAAVGRLLRSLLRRQEGNSNRLSLSTILIILQDLAAEELEEAFDRIDEVVKEGGSTTVMVDEMEK